MNPIQIALNSTRSLRRKLKLLQKYTKNVNAHKPRSSFMTNTLKAYWSINNNELK
jgi:hypothetical protein